MTPSASKDDPVLQAAKQFRDTLEQMGFHDAHVFVAYGTEEEGVRHCSALPGFWDLKGVSARLACITASVVRLNKERTQNPGDFLAGF